MAIRHFLTLRDLTTQELKQVIQSAIEMKSAYRDDAKILYLRVKS